MTPVNQAAGPPANEAASPTAKPVRVRRMTAAMTVAAVIAVLAGAATAAWAQWDTGDPLASAVVLALAIVAFGVVGGVLALARPDNRLSWLLLGAACCWAVGEACRDLGMRAPDSTGNSVLLLIGEPLRAVGWLAVALVPAAVFPDGHLPGRRWRWLGIALAGNLVLTFTGTALSRYLQDDTLRAAGWHNPLRLPTVVSTLGDALSALSLLFLVTCVAGVVAGLITRYRRGPAPLRRQLLVLAAAAVVPVVVIPTAFGAGAPQWYFSLSVLPLPVAVAVAILTGGLFDLATVANRSLVWATLSATIVAIYALVVAGAGSLVGHPGDRRLPWLAAGVVAISFVPVRDLLQGAVNRLTYGRWREPYGVLAALGQRVEAAADGERLLGEVVTELRTGLGFAEVALLDAHGTVVAGQLPAQPVTVPLTAYGRPVGALCYAQPGTPLRPTDHRLLDDLGAQLGGLLHAHALTADLVRARERLVLAREEERRRLRRDLHDGLGPALAGLMLKADTAHALVHADPDAAADRLVGLRTDLQNTVLDVRRLVEGLRPPALDELGLGPAIRQAVQRLGSAGPDTAGDRRVPEFRIDIAEPLPPVPAAVEVALYRIITEAVTNTVRHARASHCTVSVTPVGAALVARIADDGPAADTGKVNGASHSTGAGHGMATMRERAEELGGTLRIERSGGTAIIATLPVPPRPDGSSHSDGSPHPDGAQPSEVSA